MDTALRSVQLDIPQTDFGFFKELAKKMGWRMVLPVSQEEKQQTLSRIDLIKELRGIIQLPDDFDYKKAREEALIAKYL